MATVNGRSCVGCFKVSLVAFVQRRVEWWIESKRLKLTVEWSNYEGMGYAVLIANGSKSARARLEDYCDALSDCDHIVADWFAMKKAAAELR
jgi:hypothetical protein